MSEETKEEILQEERNPDADMASGEREAAQAQDTETAKAESDTETGHTEPEEADLEGTEAEEMDGKAENASQAAGDAHQDSGDDSGDVCQDTGEVSEEDQDQDGSGDKKGFFSRLKKGDKEKAALQEKVEALEDRVKRQMAEFENFRRRTDKEKQQMFSMGERNVIEKMLPIVDNFERGLAAIPEEEKEGPIASGMEMIYRQLLKQMEDMGVAPIEAVGREFDPEFHNAVMQVESQEYESGTVAQEFQKGYTYHGAVIRHSMVGVAQ